MDPLSPAYLKNPSEYGDTDDSDASGRDPDSNFWEADYRPTENIDDIPLSSDKG
jgi:hypothetical protein